MSEALLNDVERAAEHAALEACWAQWASISSQPISADALATRSVIDPEALILLSLYVHPGERRLGDLVSWWARAGSHLTSVQRAKSVADQFPDDVRTHALPLFARLAADSGDRRWKRLASDGTPIPGIRSKNGAEELKLISASTLWPRLRAAFGVGAKADALAFLLGIGGVWASAKMISVATGYSTVAIRRAASDMALARLIRAAEGRPTEYLAPAGPWAELLELHPTKPTAHPEPRIPRWRFWSEVFAFLAHAMNWAREIRADDGHSPRVAASQARDIIEDHSLAFQYNDIPVPTVEAFKGTAASEALLETVRTVAGWMEDHL